jgi:hypothetical protein
VKSNRTVRSLPLTALAALPTLAAAQGDPAESSRLWWMWVVVTLLLVGVLMALMFGRGPRGKKAG